MTRKKNNSAKPMNERRCNCQKCAYCRDRNKYEKHYVEIRQRGDAISILKQQRLQEQLTMPVKQLIESVEEEDGEEAM
jgi:hypothetical protein